MKIGLEKIELKTHAKTTLVLGCYEQGELTPTAKKIDTETKGLLKQLIKEHHFEARVSQVLPLFNAHPTYSHIVLIGCGKSDGMSKMGFRKLLLATMRTLIAYKINKASLFLSEIKIKQVSLAWKIKQMTEIAWEGIYRFDIFKSEKDPILLKELLINLPDESQAKVCKKAFLQGEAIAKGMFLAKNLGNTPSNICTPSFLAEQAKALAKAYPKLSLTVLNEKDMQKLKMGAILAVAQGSAEEAKLICFEYRGTNKKTAPVALIGKGITFDTGGNSLKSPDSMVGMKYDMCGGATVFGVIKAVAELNLPINVVGIIPAVENMPGGSAYKPEDILTSMSGQTIEVISTDAEGRLVLSDALTYCERFKPDAVIDIATLTGAVVIALGFQATGLMANNDELAEALLEAGNESNDRAWQLPLYEEYQEQIKSPFADMANTGGRAAGTITAACFLSRFAKNFRWAHLDVAGTAAMMIGTGERMATGRPVPMLMQYLLGRAKQNVSH